MKKFFVSYSFAGTYRDSQQFHTAFGNSYLTLADEPDNYETLEKITEEIKQRVKEGNGFSRVSCVILFFKKV